MLLFQAKLIKKFLVKVFIYVKNKPFLILTVVAMSYLARLLFRLLISSWGGVENSTILDSQNTTACSEHVQERPPISWIKWRHSTLALKNTLWK